MVQTAHQPAQDWGNLQHHERVKSLELDGYVVFPNVIGAERIQLIKEEMSRLPTYGTDYSENQRGYRDLHWTDSPHTHELVGNPEIIDFLERLFADDLIVTSFMYALSKPGHPGMAIHSDAQPYGSAIFGMQASAPRLVRVLYYLDDLTPERSPLKVIPRSHLSLHADANPYHRYLSHPEEQMVMCKAGTAVIINQNLFHANYPNISREDRGLIAVAFRPAWAGPIAEVEDWDADKMSRLPAPMRKYFQSLNTKKIDFHVKNRPENMRTEAPGLSPSRWERLV